MRSTLVPIIGLEVHVELSTRTKMFCGCLTHHFRQEPNTHVCPVCLGLPGALPVPNKKALLMSIKVGLALNCKVNQRSLFERKNYFYPDLPKGYQISQYRQPLCVGGYLEIPEAEGSGLFKVRINRAHQEEDTAKLIHQPDGTLVDYNRSGVPLLEIVSEPDISSPEQAVAYLKEMQLLLRSTGVSSADMEKGTMRLEANISLGQPVPAGHYRSSADLPNYRVELKNINSFKFVKRGLEYEIARQTKALEKGEVLTQETRGYDEKSGTTYLQRSKEEAHDYRYFPEPDIPPLRFSAEEIEKVRASLGELPSQKRRRHVSEYNLKISEASLLVENDDWGQYFLELVKRGVTPDKAAKLVINRPEIIKEGLDTIVKALQQEMSGRITDTKQLKEIASLVISQNKKAVADYKSGKDSAIQALVGAAMRETKGKADAAAIRGIIKKLLD